MIQTARLFLKPLTYDQLVKYILADNSLELELHVSANNRTISPELKEALEQTILPNVADASKDYLYSTLWTVIWREANKMVGDICIVGEPDPTGEIEIGYGTYDEFQNQGFMTEAVAGIIEWARSQPKVHSIKASSDKTNIGSNTVLLKNGFIKIDESTSSFNWKLQFDKKNQVLPETF